MTYLLLIVLLFLLFVALFFFRGEIASPSVLEISVFTISVIVVILNSFKWGLDYNFEALLIIFSGLLFLISGEILAKLNVGKKKNIQNTENEIYIQRIVMILIILIMLIILLIDYRATVAGANLMSGSSETLLSSARASFSQGESQKGFVSRLIPLNKSLAYTFIYIIMYNWIIFNKKRFVYFIPVLIYFGNGVLSTGRTVLLRLVIYSLVMFLLLYINNKKLNVRDIAKISRYLLISIVSFIVLFIFLGRLGNKGLYNTPLEYMSYYSGSSIVLFGEYIEKNDYLWPDSSTNFFGSHTLIGIYNILRLIGFKIPDFEVTLEMSYIPHFYSNVYTAFRRYIQDFGLIGLYLIQFFLGFIYGKLYHGIRKNQDNGLKLILYCATVYPLVESSIEERFFTSILTSTTILEIILLAMSYYFLIGKKNRRFL